MGHTSNRCYLKYKQEGNVEVSHFKKNNQSREFTCWNSGEKGHSSRFCRKPRKNGAQEKRRTERSGNESRPSGSSPPTVRATQQAAFTKAIAIFRV
jgi:hypothetical protein